MDLRVLSVLIVFNILLKTKGSMALNTKEQVLFDFTDKDTTDDWIEISDTKREVGMSKGVFALQKTDIFSRAIFFSLLNPQPNGACFAGVVVRKNYDFSDFKYLSLKVRGQGENKNYKVILRHRGENQEPYPTYEQYFTVPTDNFDIISLPLDMFKAYYRGHPKPDADPLELANISSIGIQVYGGVYENFKQKGVSALEVDWIKVQN